MPNLSLHDVANDTASEGLKLSINQQIEEQERNEPAPDRISMAQPGLTAKPRVDINSLRNNRGDNNGKRVTANLSGLPKKNEVPNGLNFKVKESIEDDIFGSGGPFDKYLKEKTNEYTQYVNERAAKANEIEREKTIAEDEKEFEAEEVKSEAGNNTPKEDDYLEEELNDTVIVNAKHLKRVDIKRTDSTEKEETMADNIIRGNVQEYANPDMVEDEEYPIHIDHPVGNPVTTEVPEPEVEEEEEVDDTDYLEESTEEEATTEETEEVVEPKSEQPDFLEDGEELEEEYTEKENLGVENNTKPAPKKDNIDKKIDRITKAYMAIPAEDGDEDDVEVTDSDNDESMTILKNMIAEKIKPVSLKTDITGFTVAKKGTMSNEIFTMEQASFAKWALPATGITVEMREISGANLENLRGFLDRRNPDNRSALKIIYDHIVSPKPASYEAWLNSIAYADFDHLFMLVYISAFADANFLPVDCENPDCGKPYITNNIPVMDLVKFKNKESEDKFWALYNEEPTNGSGLYTTEIIPISDKFAIGLKEPSLNSVLIEPNYFNGEFMDKYAQTIRYFPYIDALYWIDAARKTLVPIKWQVYVNNAAKTARSRVRKYSMIMNTLTSDQHSLIMSYINAINERTDWMSYQRPETTCPHCGQVIPADENYTALSLVFLRSRLAVLATT